ncbi:MAG: clan AA aspartic protease [Chitinophagales bacterium]
MGLTYSKIILSNPRRTDLGTVELTSLVDTGALTLCIPQHIADRLELEELDKRLVVIADGTSRLVPYVGPIRIDVGNRFCFTGALILGNETLLGAIPMEELDVIVHPSTQRLMPNPLHPNKPGYTIKCSSLG